MQRRAFRLFISSTFSDFAEERRVLQEEVFPKVRSYCSERSFSFQPIDLRWGVSQEAQLDQKTLELCLDEVRVCKTYPGPNFLIMQGDRYGWVPLPYAIEKTELENVMQATPASDQALVQQWYKLDKNQVPISYLLLERGGKSAIPEHWQEIEQQLRAILQKACQTAGLTSEQCRKYFQSATEAETRERLITKSLEAADQDKERDGIFAFFRTIEPNGAQKSQPAPADDKQVQAFRQLLLQSIAKENTLHLYTKQNTNDQLDKQYLDEFAAGVEAFLIDKVEQHLQKIEDESHSPLAVELEQQQAFAILKRSNFLGRSAILDRIERYLETTQEQPLVIVGKSGLGKTALLSQAIYQTQKKGQRQVIYRFVGATANSSNTISIWESILEELGQSETLWNTDQTFNKSGMSAWEAKESFVNLCYLIQDKILTISQNIVIFIDALDQLSNDDQFFWLPSTLPPNIKIVLTALEDSDFPHYSRFAKRLSQLSEQFIELPPFEYPLDLLRQLLTPFHRTIQAHQQKYFLQHYQRVRSPLYVVMAAQSIRYWKSNELATDGQALTLMENKRASGFLYTLADSQSGMIKDYIRSLHLIHHHEKVFVERILAYIFAADDGISELEILSFINAETEFVQILAPDTYHTNVTGELPIIIWTRLLRMITPFLGTRTLHGTELLYFSHREFATEIHTIADTEASFAKLTTALVGEVKSKAVLRNKERDVHLFSSVIANFFHKYLAIESHKELCRSVFYSNSLDFISDVVHHLDHKSLEAFEEFDYKRALAYTFCKLWITDVMYEQINKGYGMLHAPTIVRMNTLLRLQNDPNFPLADDFMEKSTEEALKIMSSFTDLTEEQLLATIDAKQQIIAQYLSKGKIDEIAKIFADIIPVIGEKCKQYSDHRLWISRRTVLLNQAADFNALGNDQAERTKYLAIAVKHEQKHLDLNSDLSIGNYLFQLIYYAKACLENKQFEQTSVALEEAKRVIDYLKSPNLALAHSYTIANLSSNLLKFSDEVTKEQLLESSNRTLELARRLRAKKLGDENGTLALALELLNHGGVLLHSSKLDVAISHFNSARNTLHTDSVTLSIRTADIITKIEVSHAAALFQKGNQEEAITMLETFLEQKHKSEYLTDIVWFKALAYVTHELASILFHAGRTTDIIDLRIKQQSHIIQFAKTHTLSTWIPTALECEESLIGCAFVLKRPQAAKKYLTNAVRLIEAYEKKNKNHPYQEKYACFQDHLVYIADKDKKRILKWKDYQFIIGGIPGGMFRL